MMNNKGQGSGLVAGLVFGIAGLVIGTIIAFVIVSTLSGAGLLEGTRTTTTVTNETTDAFINATGYTLAEYDGSLHISLAITEARDGSDGSVIVPANYTLDTVTAIVTNSTVDDFASAEFDYTFVVKTDEEVSVSRMVSNFTTGVNNVSDKLPTVLLIAAIVLILGVLAVLVAVWQRMRIGGQSI